MTLIAYIMIDNYNLVQYSINFLMLVVQYFIDYKISLIWF